LTVPAVGWEMPVSGSATMSAAEAGSAPFEAIGSL